jgi:hypothetical protein
MSLPNEGVSAVDARRANVVTWLFSVDITEVGGKVSMETVRRRKQVDYLEMLEKGIDFRKGEGSFRAAFIACPSRQRMSEEEMKMRHNAPAPSRPQRPIS